MDIAVSRIIAFGVIPHMCVRVRLGPLHSLDPRKVSEREAAFTDPNATPGVKHCFILSLLTSLKPPSSDYSEANGINSRAALLITLLSLIFVQNGRLKRLRCLLIGRLVTIYQANRKRGILRLVYCPPNLIGPCCCSDGMSLVGHKQRRKWAITSYCWWTW